MGHPLGVPPVDHREESGGSEKSSTWAAITREFYVDFLGSLIPGLLFTLTAALPVWWSAHFVWWAILANTHASTTIAVEPLKAVEAFRIEFVCLSLVLSYVLGSVFYRRDPKVPDQSSAAYILWRERKDLSRSVIQPRPGDSVDSKEKARSVAEDEGGQFPYSHLGEYLEERGLKHLARIVPWRGKNIGSYGLRTKMFINLLKVRIQYAAPNKCSEIVRNEAHVRMMSSVWYAALAFQWLCSALTVVVSFCVVLTRSLKSPDLWGILSFLAALFLVAFWLKRVIRRFFHYQRVREIVYVLETAYWANKTHTSLLDDLSEPSNTNNPQISGEGQ